MAFQKILNRVKQPEKLLLGACSRLSSKFTLPPIAVRITFILLTLLFIPLGIILYLAAYLAFRQNKSKSATLGSLGALLGIPLSYYFQSDMIRYYGEGSGVFGYMKNFFSIVEEYDKYIGSPGDILFNVLLSMIVFAIAGGAAGYFMDKR